MWVSISNNNLCRAWLKWIYKLGSVHILDQSGLDLWTSFFGMILDWYEYVPVKKPGSDTKFDLKQADSMPSWYWYTVKSGPS